MVSAAFTELTPTIAGDVLTEGLGRYSWCLCFLSPAGYVRVRRLSPRSPSFMFQRTVPRLSSVEAAGVDSAAPCVTQKESGVGSISSRSIAGERCYPVFKVSILYTKTIYKTHKTTIYALLQRTLCMNGNSKVLHLTNCYKS